MAVVFTNELIKSRQKVKYELNDVNEPELYRDIFPFDEVCRISFDNSIIMPEIPKDVWITDTTFRDGQQSRPPYTVKQIVKLFKLLSKLSGPFGLIKQTEFFLYSDKDREAVDKCLELGCKFPEITAWIRANKDDFDLVKKAGLKETGILTSVSDYHIFLKLKKTRKEAFNDYVEIVRKALEEGIIPRCHFEDITRADFYGFVIPFTQELMKLSHEAKIPVKIRACDTMGYGVTYPGAALPRSVPKIIHSLIHDGGVPGENLEWHGHNDFHKVHTNAMTAWLFGCCGVNSSLLGIGERTGNSPLEAAVIEYLSLFGNDKMIDTTVITELGEFFEAELGYDIPSNYPLLGKEFNTTRAGIHADGVIKNKEIYSIFNTEKILNRSLDVSITDKTGVASIAHWINNNILKGRKFEKINKRHPGIRKIYDWILNQYEEGRNTVISNNEMRELVKLNMPELVESDFDKLINRTKKLAFELLEEITAKEELKTMDPAKIEPVLRFYEEMYHFIQFVYVVNTVGKKITINITQSEDREKYSKYITSDMDFSSRDWFINPMKNGEMFATKFFTSKITGELTMTVSAPLVNDNLDILGIVGLDLRFHEIAALDGKTARAIILEDVKDDYLEVDEQIGTQS